MGDWWEMACDNWKVRVPEHFPYFCTSWQCNVLHVYGLLNHAESKKEGGRLDSWNKISLVLIHHHNIILDYLCHRSCKMDYTIKSLERQRSVLIVWFWIINGHYSSLCLIGRRRRPSTLWTNFEQWSPLLLAPCKIPFILSTSDWIMKLERSVNAGGV